MARIPRSSAVIDDDGTIHAVEFDRSIEPKFRPNPRVELPIEQVAKLITVSGVVIVFDDQRDMGIGQFQIKVSPPR